MMNSKRKTRLLRWLMLTIAMVIVATLILVLRQDYTVRGYSDATFIPGVVLLLLYLLRVLKNQGTFDVISYAFARMIHGMRRQKLGEFKTAPEYVDDKRVERLKREFYYLPDIVIAVVFIITGSVLAYLG